MKKMSYHLKTNNRFPKGGTEKWKSSNDDEHGKGQGIPREKPKKARDEAGKTREEPVKGQGRASEGPEKARAKKGPRKGQGRTKEDQGGKGQGRARERPAKARKATYRKRSIYVDAWAPQYSPEII